MRKKHTIIIVTLRLISIFGKKSETATETN